MKKLNLMKKSLGCLLMIGALNLSAQQPRLNDSELAARLEADKRIDNYLQLVKMGYTDREIYEDLGNANFLSEKYETAAFWYQKLIDLAGRDAVPSSYQERYQYALHKAGIVTNAEVVAQHDWFSKIKQDYQFLCSGADAVSGGELQYARLRSVRPRCSNRRPRSPTGLLGSGSGSTANRKSGKAICLYPPGSRDRRRAYRLF